METSAEFSRVVQLPGYGPPSTVTRTNAPADPERATSYTVAAMRRAILADSNSPQVFGATRQALGSGYQGSRADVCAAIYRWICSHVTFRHDDPIVFHLLGLENELDFLVYPAALLAMRRPSEDCDGFTMLCCAMLACAGVPSEIVTIKADQKEPWRYSHVYAQALLEDGRGVVMDCSQGAQHGYPIGWEAPEYFARKTWGVIAPAAHLKPMAGLEGLGFDWGSIIDQSFKLAGQLALKPGQYVQNQGGVMASNVPGALPGQYPSTAAYNVGGISTGTILIGAAAFGALLLLGRR